MRTACGHALVELTRSQGRAAWPRGMYIDFKLRELVRRFDPRGGSAPLAAWPGAAGRARNTGRPVTNGQH